MEPIEFTASRSSPASWDHPENASPVRRPDPWLTQAHRSSPPTPHHLRLRNELAELGGSRRHPIAPTVGGKSIVVGVELGNPEQVGIVPRPVQAQAQAQTRVPADSRSTSSS